VNEAQKSVLYQKIYNRFNGDLKGKKVAVWGLSFKPKTDDMREAPSLVLIDLLIKAGCEVHAYDPVAMEEAQRHLGNDVNYGDDMYGVLDGADCLAIFTEWSEFRSPDFNQIGSRLKNKLIFDGRNIYTYGQISEVGFEYHGIGIKPINLAS
jgi:UDPglucose 6-dehydrogenase